MGVASQHVQKKEEKKEQQQRTLLTLSILSQIAMGRPVVHRSDEEEEQQQQRDEDASHSLNALATGLSPLFPFN